VVYAGNSPLETARATAATGETAALALEDGKPEDVTAGGGARRGRAN
jgi:hypothetical protein